MWRKPTLSRAFIRELCMPSVGVAMKSMYGLFSRNTKRTTSTSSENSGLTDLERDSDGYNASLNIVRYSYISNLPDMPIPQELVKSFYTLEHGTLENRIRELDTLLTTLNKYPNNSSLGIEVILRVLKNTIPDVPRLIDNKQTMFDEIHRMQAMGDLFIKCCKSLGLLVKPTDPIDLRIKVVILLIHSTYKGSDAFSFEIDKDRLHQVKKETLFYRMQQQIKLAPHRGVVRTMDKEACVTLNNLLHIGDPPEFRRLIIKGLCAN